MSSAKLRDISFARRRQIEAAEVNSPILVLLSSLVYFLLLVYRGKREAFVSRDHPLDKCGNPAFRAAARSSLLSAPFLAFSSEYRHARCCGAYVLFADAFFVCSFLPPPQFSYAEKDTGGLRRKSD